MIKKIFIRVYIYMTGFYVYGEFHRFLFGSLKIYKTSEQIWEFYISHRNVLVNQIKTPTSRQKNISQLKNHTKTHKMA